MIYKIKYEIVWINFLHFFNIRVHVILILFLLIQYLLLNVSKNRFFCSNLASNIKTRSSLFSFQVLGTTHTLAIIHELLRTFNDSRKYVWHFAFKDTKRMNGLWEATLVLERASLHIATLQFWMVHEILNVNL